MRREDHAFARPAQAVHDAREALGSDVGLSVNRRRDIGAGLELVPSEHRRALAGDRREPEAGVGHHVTDDVDAAADTLAEQRLARPLIGTEQERGHGVDGDPVVLLGHREVAAAEAGLDVRDGDSGVACRLGARAGRVRVAEDERPVGPLLREHRRDRGPHRLGVGGVEVEPVARLGQPELRVEDVGQLRIPVLAGVEADLLDAGLVQRGADRAGLDELRAVADDAEDLHRSDVTMAAAPGR